MLPAMRAVIIGAGRGSRLGPETREIPKTMVEVMGRPMLEWVLDALAAGGFQKRDVVFICGYAEHVVRERYPEFTFVRNEDWENNNILLSLMHAEDLMNEPFICCYSDILFSSNVVRDLLRKDADISLVVDTEWLQRYEDRTEHPSDHNSAALLG